jgi:hypothetical protein
MMADKTELAATACTVILPPRNLQMIGTSSHGNADTCGKNDPNVHISKDLADVRSRPPGKAARSAMQRDMTAAAAHHT